MLTSVKLCDFMYIYWILILNHLRTKIINSPFVYPSSWYVTYSWPPDALVILHFLHIVRELTCYSFCSAAIWRAQRQRTYLCRYLDGRQLSTKPNMCIRKIKVVRWIWQQIIYFLFSFLYKDVNALSSLPIDWFSFFYKGVNALSLLVGKWPVSLLGLAMKTIPAILSLTKYMPISMFISFM